jgi:hypothetical protein
MFYKTVFTMCCVTVSAEYFWVWGVSVFKNVFIVVVLFLFGSANAIAVDLNGRVVTGDGTPICALVLASGRTTFSCNPSGPFKLVGLPTEPDGSIKLQVYADGFFPYIKSIRDFSFQNVVMQRAQSCSIDDGLSDTSPLDGVYTLLRASVQLNDGTIFDSAGPRLDTVGSQTIRGNTINQSLTVTIDGQPLSIETSATFEDHLYILPLFLQGVPQYELILIERGRKFVTLVNANVIGEPAVEVDQWEKVAGTAAVQAMSAQSQGQLPAAGPPGSLFVELLETYGLRQLLSK